MSEWGLPDWRDEAAYGDTTKWGQYRWRWEFTRRRPDYREHYQRRIASDDTTSEETIPHRWADFSPFGLVTLLDPRVSNQPPVNLIVRSSTPAEIYGKASKLDSFASASIDIASIDGKAISLWLSEHDFGIANLLVQDSAGSTIKHLVVGPRHTVVSVPDGYAAVVFDLAKPIERQWKGIAGRLRRRQERTQGEVRDTRIHRTKWLRYLRVLDAREEGCSWDEIAKSGVLGAATSKHPDRDQRVKAAKATWQQARRIQFYFPS